jgi:hypothetical protein
MLIGCSIDRDKTAPLLGGGLPKADRLAIPPHRGLADARVVHERIDPAVFDQSRARHMGKAVGLRQIGCDRLHASPQSYCLLLEFSQGAGIAVYRGNVVARFDQAHGHRQTDAARGAGHDHCIAVRGHSAFPLLNCIDGKRPRSGRRCPEVQSQRSGSCIVPAPHKML